MKLNEVIRSEIKSNETNICTVCR